VVDLRTGRITSAEALLRWKHPERGLVSPLDFIPLAEETGLILPIGEWVLRTACRQASALQHAGLPAIRIAVNLAARQLAQADIVETVSRILADAAVHPKQIGLELTESSLIQNADAAKQTLDQVSALGVHISIDDFGTGYSSLSYLQRFPIDTLKIDRSFVQHLPHNSDNNAIATAIVTLAHALQMTVVAEGVETADQLDYLASIGCESMQGYYFSKPIPAEQFMALVAKNAAQAEVA
jgi:EAL domain-containing protein (putative c-di-GMP-specific phosphodiesterase class I)